MKPNNYFFVTGLIFTFIGLLHLLRLANKWEAVIGGWQIPLWLSWAAVIIAGYLAWQAWYRIRS